MVRDQLGDEPGPRERGLQPIGLGEKRSRSPLDQPPTGIPSGPFEPELPLEPLSAALLTASKRDTESGRPGH
jgi:hypothetical protein